MCTNSCGAGGAAEDCGDLFDGEALPRQHAEKILVGEGQGGESALQGFVICGLRSLVSGEFSFQTLSKLSTALLTSSLVRQRLVDYSEEPESTFILGRQVCSAAPCSGPCLGHHISRVFPLLHPTQRKAKEIVVVGFEENLEVAVCGHNPHMSVSAASVTATAITLDPER